MRKFEQHRAVASAPRRRRAARAAASARPRAGRAAAPDPWIVRAQLLGAGKSGAREAAAAPGSGPIQRCSHAAAHRRILGRARNQRLAVMVRVDGATDLWCRVELRRLANVRRAPKRRERGRAARCGRCRWRRAGRCRTRRTCATCRRSRRSRPGVRHRRGRGRSGPRWPRIARKRMISAPNAAFRVDRSQSLCFAGRFDIREPLHDDLHRL